MCWVRCGESDEVEYLQWYWGYMEWGGRYLDSFVGGWVIMVKLGELDVPWLWIVCGVLYCGLWWEYFSDLSDLCV